MARRRHGSRKKKLEQRMQSDTNISWALDTQQDTHMISMNFHYYSDVACDMNFDVIIQGALGSYKECEKLTDKIVDEFERLS